MTDRERWTVYPLLFLALGLSLKDKLTQSVSTKTVICNELLVHEPGTQKQVHLTAGQVAATGEVVSAGDLKAPALVCNSLFVVNKQGKVVATVSSNNNHSGAVNVADPQGKVLASITSNNDGGLVNVIGLNTGTTSVLGNFQQLAGLMFVDSQGRPHASPATFVSPLHPTRPAGAETPAVEEKPTENGKASEEKPAEVKPPEQKAAEEAPAEGKPEA